MQLDTSTYRVSGASKFILTALVVGLLGLGASAAGLLSHDLQAQATHSYLVALVFWTVIGLGALAFVMIHHMTHARWGVVIRRVQESVTFGVPVMFFLFLPLLGLLLKGSLAGEFDPATHYTVHALYPWTNAEFVASSVVMQSKTAWLNPNFFALRTCIYFVIWTILIALLWRNSRRQDEEGPTQGFYDRVRTISGPGIVIFALSLTFASFDWLMSVTPLWYSTMFGVYLFAMAMLSMWSFMALLVSFLRGRGVLQKEVTIEHYHDMGKWMFAFTVFWGYIAFCQFLLMWYANIPEETEYYMERWNDGWRNWSWLVLAGHFFVPFLLLMSRIPKRRPAAVIALAVWILAMHWVDLYWLIMPNLHHDGVAIHWLDFSTLIGVGGIFVATVLWRLTSAPVLALKDPYLQKSIDFVNA